MKIMVSACLAGENCKYNGGNNWNEKVLRLMEENEVITVCPEQLGGLPTPRVPSEICNGIVTAKDGRIVDTEFRAGAAKCLEIARREKPDLIVLQSFPCAVREELADAVRARLNNSRSSGTDARRRSDMRRMSGRRGSSLGRILMLSNQRLWARTRDELVQEVESLGFPAELGEAIAKHLGSPKAQGTRAHRVSRAPRTRWSG